MIHADSFRALSIQCSFFTPYVEFRPASILAYLLETVGNIFDGEPLSMPLPPDAPPQIPRIILSSKDHAHKIEVAKERANIFWFRTKEEEDPDLRHLVDEFHNILKGYVSSINVEPARISAVLSRFTPVENPAKVLAEHFCKQELNSGPLNRPENFELHSHKRFTMSQDYIVNSWLRAKTGQTKADKRRVIIVEQDINTLAEEAETRKYNPDEIKGFYDAVIDEFNSILSLYFP